MTDWIYNDGGRAAAGYKGTTGDCVTRAIAIATGKPYAEVYAELNAAAQAERPRGRRKRSSARTGVNKATIRKYLESLGWNWKPCMGIGTGCTTHPSDFGPGTYILSLSKHLTVIRDGVIHDTYDPSRNDTRCVYGYWGQGKLA